jgi:SAM-dependent methyltransferase
VDPVVDRFGKDAWEQHWREAVRDGVQDAPNPYLAVETSGLRPGTGLDAGCGSGADAVWLAQHGWAVTGVDVAPTALAAAAERAAGADLPVTWLEADLTAWSPAALFDLVVTAYAHAAIPQLQLYRRIGDWVAPGGTLLIVGHDSHDSHDSVHAAQPPEGSTVTVDEIAALFDGDGWRIRTARAASAAAPGHPVRHHDVVVRAERSAA